MLEELEEFEHRGRVYSVFNPGWSANGKTAYEIENELGNFMDTVFVGPLETLEEAVEQWKAQN